MYIRDPKFLVKFSETGNGKAHWKIVGYPSGKRQIHWFKDERDAKREATTLNLAIKRHGPEAESMTTLQRLDAYRALQLAPPNVSLTEAVAFYVQQKSFSLPPKPLKEIVEECLEWNFKRSKNGEVSEAQCKCLQKGSVRLLREFGDRDANEITKPQLVKWLGSMTYEGTNELLSPTTRDFFRRYASHYLSFAVERGYIRTNPAIGIARTGTKGEISILSVDECRRLLDHAPWHFRHYYIFGLFAGLRPESEIKRLDWSAVDWEDNLITVQNHKTDQNTRSARYRHVLMEPNMRAWLEPYRDWAGPVWPIGWDSTHRNVRKAAGVYDSWIPDVMRHTYASFLLAAKQNVEYVADQMGHTSSAMIFKHYRRLVKQSEATEFWNIYPTQQLEERYAEVSPLNGITVS